jgi:hypothetical protein
MNKIKSNSFLLRGQAKLPTTGSKEAAGRERPLVLIR